MSWSALMTSASASACFLIALLAGCGPVTQAQRDAAASRDGDTAEIAVEPPADGAVADVATEPPPPIDTRKGDGEPCAVAADCVSGACVEYYRDADNDGYPGQPGRLCGGAPPAGWSAAATDCCDSDADAHPGQTRYFTAARSGCGGFDYNCNGTAEKQFTSVLTCADFTPTGVPDKWYQSVPACGVTAPLGAPEVTCCPSCVSIHASVTDRTQACR